MALFKVATTLSAVLCAQVYIFSKFNKVLVFEINLTQLHLELALAHYSSFYCH